MKMPTESAFDPFQFRGNPRQRAAFHRKMLRHFRGCARVLDLGCGDGDFLAAARTAGIDTFGIDHSEAAIRACAARGISAEQEDVLAFVESRREEVSVFDGIYCAHVVEHLNPQTVLRLLGLLHGAMREGSRLVLVTPNMEDLSVATHTFWLDITHVRPYPAELLQALVEAAGFHKVKTYTLHGLGMNLHYLRQLVFQKPRFGRRILRPNLVATAER